MGKNRLKRAKKKIEMKNCAGKNKVASNEFILCMPFCRQASFFLIFLSTNSVVALSYSKTPRFFCTRKKNIYLP